MEQDYNGLEVAVIGIACKLPGADNIKELWNNLSESKESIKFLSKEELKALHINESLIKDPKYVNCVGGELKDKDEFDASFFNVNHAEAMLMDPQIRVFLETAWHALEDAGCAYEQNKSIGVYAAAKSSFFWQSKSFFAEEFGVLGGFAASTLSNKDFLSTTISYKLNLTGPSMVLHSTCSSSLVGIHQACQALNCGECDMALAGGVNIVALDNKGYLHQDGMIYSADGHCRPFDENASGTIEGEGIGVVLLKPLEDAIKDGDHIYAIVKGTAVNNDGNVKLGFTAPSVQGQRKVIEMAHLAAEVEPESIGYIEAHGTGTNIGDPIEIEALQLAFNSTQNNFCGIGSVKANIGHLDAAAGVTGFIKAVLSLHHKKILPATNFETPNSKIDFDNSPFYINRKLKEWKSDHYPLRAGVSSFGMGGTNAHVVLEEAPSRRESSQGRNIHLIQLSAKSEAALEKSFDILKRYCSSIYQERINLADIAYSLQVGRKPMPYRMAFVTESVEQINNTPFVFEKVTREESRKVFMFSGQGNQYINMGKDLYDSDSIFKNMVDECFELLRESSPINFKKILFDQNRKDIDSTEIAQPLLFVIEYATARLLMSWGITPDGLVGHSIGEYVAACLSGVFTLKSALKIVSTRGKLMQLMPSGSMISVNITEKEAVRLISEQLDIAVVNSDESCVLSGDAQSIKKFTDKAEQDGYSVIQLHTSHAFHSRMMDPMLNTFLKELNQIELQAPVIPFLSNLTGTWITKNEATDPNYWVNQLRNTVRFSQCIDTLEASGFSHYIEVGPGASLGYFVNCKTGKKLKTFSTIRHFNKKENDVHFLFKNIAEMWMNNIVVDWQKFYQGEVRNKIPLPGYPFEKEKFWIDDSIISNSLLAKPLNFNRKEELSKWFYSPFYKQKVSSSTLQFANKYLVFDKDDLASKFDIENMIKVEPGISFKKIANNRFIINPKSKADYIELIKSIDDFPEAILDLWSYDIDHTESPRDVFEPALLLIGSLTQVQLDKKIYLSFITNAMHNVLGNEIINPTLSLLKGVTKVAPQEIVNLSVRIIDVDYLDEEDTLKELTNTLFNEDTVIFRNGRKWIIDWEQILVPLEGKQVIKNAGTYLITGGSGKMATAIANYLIEVYKANIILISRKGTNDDITNEKVIHIKGNISNQEHLDKKIFDAEQKLGKINGAFHTAGLTTELLLEQTSEEFYLDHFDAKVYGTNVLYELLKNRDVDFVLLTSSLASILGGLGYTTYASVNNYQDAFAQWANTNKTTWLSINFDGWEFTTEQSDIIVPNEGMKIIEGVLNKKGVSQLAVSTSNLNVRMDKWVKRTSEEQPKIKKRAIIKRKRPDLQSEYKEPFKEVEKAIEDIINVYFNFERIGLDDNFFDLGGDSLMALSILSRIHEKLQVRLSVKEFYEAPTIRGLAKNVLIGTASTYSHINRAEKKEYYTLSSIQNRIYFASSLNKESVNYNLSSFYHITDIVSYEEIGNIFTELAQRHEALRTSFKMVNKKPVQIINPIDKIELEVFKEGSNNDNNILKRNQNIINEFVRPFDLGDTSLMRVGVIELKNNEKLLMLDFHHIISDAVTGNVILNEMVQMFKKETLKPVKIHYKDFSEWHIKLLGSQALKKQKNYWLNRLNGDLTYLKLPADYEKPETEYQKAETVYFEVEEEDYSLIQKLMAETNTSSFIFMLSAAYILFYKYSGQEDLIIGTETAGRSHSDIQDTVGMFVGLLPLRNNVSPDMSFNDFLLKVKEHTLQDFDNQLYQFNDLVRDLNIKSKIDTNPLFNILVSLDNISTTFSADAESAKKDLKAQKLEFRQKETIWDIRLGIIDVKDKMVVRLDYASQIYARSNCQILSERYVQIIQQIIREPEILINNITITSLLKKATSDSKQIEEVDFDFIN